MTAVNSRADPRTAQRETLHAADGRPLAELTRRRDALTLTLRSDGLDGFEDWLATHLADIHAQWRDAQAAKVDSCQLCREVGGPFQEVYGRQPWQGRGRAFVSRKLTAVNFGWGRGRAVLSGTLTSVNSSTDR